MGRRFDTVSFLSDYGTVDEFVGVVKAVIRDLAPHAVVVDLGHHVPRFDVRAGSLMLARAISYVPTGVVLAVVDPGVGTDRRAIAIEVADGDGVLVGPDNGLLAPAVAMAGGSGRAFVLDNAEVHLASGGATFAGRDIFAPVAAALCNGADLTDLGSMVDAEALLPGIVPLPREEGGGLQGEVLWVDHFGNCQLNIGPDDVEGWGSRLRVAAGDVTRVAARTESFAALGPGAVGLVLDSYGMLALALDRRSAAEELSIAPGDLVTITRVDDGGTSIPVALGAPRKGGEAPSG